MSKNIRRQKQNRDWKNHNHNKNARQFNNEKHGHEHIFHKHIYENIEEEKKKEEAILALKNKEVICPICNKIIEDLPSAITDKTSGNPAHFECILSQLEKTEKVGENEKIAYIGQGRFAVLHYENLNDLKSFKIIKTIEWEAKDSVQNWRSEMSDLYSKVL